MLKDEKSKNGIFKTSGLIKTFYQHLMEMGNRQFIFQLKTFDLKAESDKRCSHIPGNKNIEVFNRNHDCRYFFILTPDVSKILLSSDIFTLDSESKFIPNSLSFSQEHIYNKNAKLKLYLYFWNIYDKKINLKKAWNFTLNLNIFEEINFFSKFNNNNLGDFRFSFYYKSYGYKGINAHKEILNSYIYSKRVKTPDSDKKCENGGNLKKHRGRYICVCQTGTFGNICENFVCIKKPHQSKCIAKNKLGPCDEGWGGRDCQTKLCLKETKCATKKCKIIDGNRACVCGKNRAGEFCQYACPNKCDRGQCSVLNGILKCICETGFYGKSCSEGKKKSQIIPMSSDFLIIILFIITIWLILVFSVLHCKRPSPKSCIDLKIDKIKIISNKKNSSMPMLGTKPVGPLPENYYYIYSDKHMKNKDYANYGYNNYGGVDTVYDHYYDVTDYPAKNEENKSRNSPNIQRINTKPSNHNQSIKNAFKKFLFPKYDAKPPVPKTDHIVPNDIYSEMGINSDRDLNNDENTKSYDLF